VSNYKLDGLTVRQSNL